MPSRRGHRGDDGPSTSSDAAATARLGAKKRDVTTDRGREDARRSVGRANVLGRITLDTVAEHDSNVERRRAVGWVDGLGSCEFRQPTAAVDRFLAPYYDAANIGSAREFVDSAASYLIFSPRLSPSDVGGLSEPARAAIRSGVAEAVGLSAPRAAAKSDQQLFAAMRERWRDLAGQLEEMFGGLRLLFAADGGSIAQELWDGIRTQAQAVDIRQLLATAAQGAAEFTAQWRAVAWLYEENSLTFPLGRMRSNAAFNLLLDARDRGDEVVVAALERALQDPGLLDAVHAAISKAEGLHVSHRVEFLSGLEGFRNGREWAGICGQLLGSLEGALWMLAEKEGVIDTHGQLLRSTVQAPNRPKLRIAKSVNRLLDVKVGLDLDRYLRLYLNDRVFDGTGHGLRHRRSHSGHRAYSVWALVGAIGVVDRVEGTRLMDAVGQQLDALLAEAARAT